MNEIHSNSHLYITKEPSMDFDIRRSFELLGNIGSQDWTDEDSDGLFKMVCHYISRYVYRLYGMSYINRWMREHQGSSFIDLFTASDVAYTNMSSMETPEFGSRPSKSRIWMSKNKRSTSRRTG